MSIQLEQSVLGGLLLDNSRMAEIDLTRDDFTGQGHADIFEAIQSLIADETNADAVTVADLLERSTRLKGWLATVATLANNTPSAANVVHYARLVREESKRRRALEIAEGLRVGIDEEGLSAIDTAIGSLMALNSSRKNYECPVKEAAAEALEAIDKAFQNRGKPIGLTTGLHDLDECIGGLHASDLIVIGARPAIGKTAFLLNLADNAGKPVGVISSEQGREQVGLRLIAKNARLSAHHLRLGRIEEEWWPKMTKAVSHLAARQVWINDQPRPTVEQVMRQARKWRHQYGIEALYVDYIQHLQGPERVPLREQIIHIVRSLKRLARELDIAVVALAQVNREVDKRADRRPWMSDLMESGAIEAEADSVMLLYRDDAYNDDSPQRGTMEINVAKNRHGPTGLIRCAFHAESMTVTDLYRGVA